MRRPWATLKEPESPRTNGEKREVRGVRRVLLGEQAQARAVSPPVVASSPDPLDAAREWEGEAVRLAVLQRRHELDAMVEEVLQSLATGQHGRCIECGRHIALARLRAMPLVVRCLACQERFEGAARIAAARESRYNVEHIQEVTL